MGCFVARLGDLSSIERLTKIVSQEGLWINLSQRAKKRRVARGVAEDGADQRANCGVTPPAGGLEATGTAQKTRHSLLS